MQIFPFPPQSILSIVNISSKKLIQIVSTLRILCPENQNLAKLTVPSLSPMYIT